ncbi:MAG: ribosome biogenesis GTP-binding protein YihA/YsxC [Gammaproteobacteria bacterium]|nr:ribosome biogenesis GTP-binding protein YihA/YsxC [Gammaproteobacteria bacterium]
MTKINYEDATFLLSAARLAQLPQDTGIEVAFVGRSNAGKSSVLNQITQNKKLARVSKTPGRTQLINVFELDETRRLIDLPGYGYAKVPQSVKDLWQKTLGDYLLERNCLKGLIVVMDIRHPLTDFDQNLLEWADESDLSVHILLNKADKLAFGASKNTLLEVKKFVTKYTTEITCQCFSALKNTGIKELRDQLNEWYR